MVVQRGMLVSQYYTVITLTVCVIYTAISTVFDRGPREVASAKEGGVWRVQFWE
jgi:hypothetical protein